MGRHVPQGVPARAPAGYAADAGGTGPEGSAPAWALLAARLDRGAPATGVTVAGSGMTGSEGPSARVSPGLARWPRTKVAGFGSAQWTHSPLLTTGPLPGGQVPV